MISLPRKILGQKIINTFWHLPVAILANIIYGFPSRKLTVVGVTGTDGKTTTVNMIYQILKNASKKVSMVSTINAVIGGKKYDTGFHVTSPNTFMVQRFIKQAVKNGDEYIVLEVTSHGLNQNRFWGVKFDVGVITNITHEHLDYHKSFENYFKAKAKLIINSKLSIINKDEEHFAMLAKLPNGKVVSFGVSKEADFNPIKFPIRLNIKGEYNLLNGLAASAATSSLGISASTIKKALSQFKGLPGRMEEVKNRKGIKIIIDYAHTPNGLREALKTLRSHMSSGKLISLIGCEGFRDMGKRPIMGETAQKLSDVVIVTAVDPRGQINTINQAIEQGSLKAGAKKGVNFFIINNRENAISFAINNLAKKGDTIGIFGKGHETSMNLDGKIETPWSDHQAVLNSLNKR